MPAIPTVLTGATFVNGLLSTFRDAYSMPAAQSPYLTGCMALDLPSNSRKELYGYHESAPYPRLSPYGETMRFKGFKARQWETVNYPYKLGIGWNRFDRNDDKLQSLMSQAQMGGQHFVSIDERAFFETLLGSASQIMPSIPNAPDGVAMNYATDDAGADRFGVSGGNIETGGGVSTAQAVRSDFWQARQRFARMLDTEGQPLWGDKMLDQGFTVIYSAANEEVFREAFLQGRTHSVISSTGAAVTNTIVESGIPLTLWSTVRLDGTNDWWVIAKGAPHKSFYSQMREPVSETFHTYDNSDHAATTDEEWVQWVARKGYGVGPCYGNIKVNN